VPRPSRFIRRALSGEERLSVIWWRGCLPVALAATALTFLAEALRVEGRHDFGNFFDVLKLLVLAAWLIAMWRSAGKAGSRLTTATARVAVAAGVITAALTV
jgi:hypothetical protein